jgi:hypothetical protein
MVEKPEKQDCIQMRSKQGQNYGFRQTKPISEPTITVRRYHPGVVFFFRGNLARFWAHFSGAFCRQAKQESMAVTVANNYWSSSTYVPNTTNAWNVNFNNGNTNADNKTNDNYVRLVRGG